VDNDYVVKIYRKLVSGINPEIEVSRFLTEVAGFANAPALLGSVELVEGDSTSAVAVVHAFVQNQGDAWTVTAAYLDRFVDEQRLLAASEHPGESEEQIPYLRYMSQIGRRVAEMHLALASSDEFADFAPEPVQPDDVQRWIADAAVRAESVFNALAQRRDTIREADRLLVDQVLAHRETLQHRLGALLPSDIDGLNIRHHGDFHLGQILIVKDDIFIIDFEGEPRRPLNERRRKAPAARDVAGLIRSIDYSATAALGRALKVTPDEHGKLAAALAEWRDRSTAAFLAAYQETMTLQRLWPADPQAAGQMLNFFLLEKVLYEIEYELAHRPEWLRVPLTGAIRILSQHSNEAS
jgi:maltose alpha-D-glucosyltransferase/alpha-amylase